MTEFIDTYPELPIMIDIGGMKYYMGKAKPIELAYRSRAEFKNDFGNDPRTEFILRKYMFPDLLNKAKLSFSNPEEKDELIKILEKRAQKLKESNEFSSSLLKNTIFQRSYLNIQRLLQKLKGSDYNPLSDKKGFSMPDILTCTKNKKYLKTISEDRLLELILELSWMLLHPDAIPKDVECTWASLVKQLDTLRLGDIMTMIREEEAKKSIKTDKKPLNYLERIDLQKVGKAPSIKNALDQAKEMAIIMQGENAKEEMKKRLEVLLNMLEVKKYLSKNEWLDESRKDIISTDVGKISKKLIGNPMRGGSSATLDKPLGIAIKPLYDYFKITFDPVYSVVEKGVTSITQGKPDTTKTITIPSLLTLLHLCNNLNRPQVSANRNNYGVYRIINVGEDIISFMTQMFNSTVTYLEPMTDDKAKYTFKKQIWLMPKVRLTTLLNPIGDKNYGYTDPDKIPFTQFFLVDKNLSIPPKEKFLDAKKPERTEILYNELTSFFNSKDLYIVYTEPDDYEENIPMNMFQVDLNTVDVGQTGIQVNNLDDNYFNKNKTPELFLNQLLTLKKNIIFNDSELALSIFLAFKELMPK